MRLLLLAASLLPASLGKAIKGCVPKAPSPTVIHIPKTGGAYQRGVRRPSRMFTPCIVGTTATFYFPYFTNKKAKRVIPVPLLLGNSSCSWHHVPPRYFRYGAAASPYAGRRTVCFVRDPVSRWLSEAFYRKVAFSARSLNAYTAQLVGRLRGTGRGRRSGPRPSSTARRSSRR